MRPLPHILHLLLAISEKVDGTLLWLFTLRPREKPAAAQIKVAHFTDGIDKFSVARRWRSWMLVRCSDALRKRGQVS